VKQVSEILWGHTKCLIRNHTDMKKLIVDIKKKKKPNFFQTLISRIFLGDSRQFQNTGQFLLATYAMKD
jgi:hypothetical protein